VQFVLRGRADAAFAWSTLSGNAAEGYSRGVLTDLARSGEFGVRSLAVVWRSPPIGHSPFAVLRTLSVDDKAKLKAYLLGLSEADPAAYDILDPLYGGGYAGADAQDYSSLASLLAQNIDGLELPVNRPMVRAAPPGPDLAPN
jgi:phosphonate transport system substrate-binding protein